MAGTFGGADRPLRAPGDWEEVLHLGLEPQEVAVPSVHLGSAYLLSCSGDPSPDTGFSAAKLVCLVS